MINERAAWEEKKEGRSEDRSDENIFPHKSQICNVTITWWQGAGHARVRLAAEHKQTKRQYKKTLLLQRHRQNPRGIAHWGVCSGADGCSAHNTQKASAIKPETSSPVTHTCLASRSPACPPPSAWRLAGPHRVTPIIAIPDWTRRASS